LVFGKITNLTISSLLPSHLIAQAPFAATKLIADMNDHAANKKARHQLACMKEAAIPALRMEIGEYQTTLSAPRYCMVALLGCEKCGKESRS
jgi:hypothetical protein